MNIVYEETGSFKLGRVLQEQGGAFQVETQHGKRTKVKANAIMLRFENVDLTSFATQMDTLAAEVDTTFLWECAPQEEVDFIRMAQEYFGAGVSTLQQAAVLTALHAAPMYFHRKGRGVYRPAPPDILQAALAGLEKKRLAAEQQEAWTQALVAGQLPEAIAKQATHLLVHPDKNTLEYKALMQACAQVGRSPEVLLLECGAFASVHSMMRARFVVEYFPRGTECVLPPLPTPEALNTLPVAAVRAFSIDDISTTEIDDAFSITLLENGCARVGVHIAAPALWIARDSQWDRAARERLSTVYAPGDKITMLPESVVNMATLAQDRTVPALSLYTDIDTSTGASIGEPFSVVEQVPIAVNLRHNHLDPLLSLGVLEGSEALADPSTNSVSENTELANPEPVNPEALAQAQTWLADLSVLWVGAKALKAERERVRGQPEKTGRIDFNFYVQADGSVDIEPRRRDAPLDQLVAEWMIHANREWGGLLQQHNVPGAYRVQPPMGRVRMSTHAGPHAGLGVPQYAWSTSPLRRYVDLINQQQLVAVLSQAPAPYPPNDIELMSVLNQFDVTYKAYADFQNSMERYWCLRWVEQRGFKHFTGVVVNDELVRLDAIPLFVRLVGVTPPGRGMAVEVELTEVDPLSLTVSCSLLGLKQGTPTRLLEDDAQGVA